MYKRQIKDIARDLIRLYSQRKQEKGFSYTHDSFMQHELEASFIYEDTHDQLTATQDATADMESDRPMDRLVCGDVGFGKTEVEMCIRDSSGICPKVGRLLRHQPNTNPVIRAPPLVLRLIGTPPIRCV